MVENNESTKQWFTAHEACLWLGISRRTLSRMIARGVIRYSRPFYQLRFRIEWLEEFNSRSNGHDRPIS